MQPPCQTLKAAKIRRRDLNDIKVIRDFKDLKEKPSSPLPDPMRPLCPTLKHRHQPVRDFKDLNDLKVLNLPARADLSISC